MCPVLDLQVYIDKDDKIKYQFFSKPSASKFVIPNKSAHSKQMKMSVLVEEGVRRMRNNSRGPLRKKGRDRLDCIVCASGKPGMCEKNSVGYRITCESCLGDGQWVHYEGETGRNAYSRGLEHSEDLRSEKEDTPLWKHCLLSHNGMKQSFVMKPLRNFSSPLQRQANEGVRITSSRAQILMNSKNEWHQAPIIRVVASSGLAGDQGEDQTPALASRGWRGSRGRGGRGGGFTHPRGRRNAGTN